MTEAQDWSGTWDEAKMHAAVLRGRHARPLIGPSENPPGPRGPLHPGHACPWALDTASRHNLPFVRGVQYRQPGQLREPHTVSAPPISFWPAICMGARPVAKRGPREFNKNHARAQLASNLKRR